MDRLIRNIDRINVHKGRIIFLGNIIVGWREDDEQDQVVSGSTKVHCVFGDTLVGERERGNDKVGDDKRAKCCREEDEYGEFLLVSLADAPMAVGGKLSRGFPPSLIEPLVHEHSIDGCWNVTSPVKESLSLHLHALNDEKLHPHIISTKEHKIRRVNEI